MDKFEETLISFLEEKLGKGLCGRYLDMIKKEVNISTFTGLDKYTQKSVVVYLIENFYAKIVSPEDLKKHKFILFYRFFGRAGAIELMQLTKYNIQPITFLYFMFGSAMGELVKQAGEAIFGEKNIEHKDEFLQVMFVKRTLTVMFDKYDPKLMKDLFLRFAIFLKVGEDPNHNLLLYIIQNDNRPNPMMNFLSSILSFFMRSSEEIFAKITDEQIKDTLQGLGINNEDMGAWLYKIHNNIDEFVSKQDYAVGAGASNKGTSMVNDIRKVLDNYMSSTKAQEIVRHCNETIGVHDISTESESKKDLYIRYLLQNTEVSEFSSQKKSLIEGKIRQILTE